MENYSAIRKKKKSEFHANVKHFDFKTRNVTKFVFYVFNLFFI